MLVPDVGGVGFSDYGEIDVKTMADHFYSESALKATQLKDKWRKFKYDLANWKKKVPEELRIKMKTAHGQSTQMGQLPPQEFSSRKSRLRKSQKLSRDTNRQQSGVCKG